MTSYPPQRKSWLTPGPHNLTKNLKLVALSRFFSDKIQREGVMCWCWCVVICHIHDQWRHE
jgi:hypothetical protein